jgi:hypothetical protein
LLTALFNQNFTQKSTGMKILLKYGSVHLGLLLLLTFLLIWITGREILTPEFYANSGDPLSGIPGQGAAMLDMMQKWVYISSAIYLLIKLGFITLILYTALYLNNQNVSLSSIFKITVLAEFIFLIPAAIKITTFPSTYPNGTLLDWHQYYILSALIFFKDVPADWYYALQTFNVFEILYWFLLGFGISKISDLGYDKSLRIVLVSYVPSLLIWIAAVTFISLLMFPSTG